MKNDSEEIKRLAMNDFKKSFATTKSFIMSGLANKAVFSGIYYDMRDEESCYSDFIYATRKQTTNPFLICIVPLASHPSEMKIGDLAKAAEYAAELPTDDSGGFCINSSWECRLESMSAINGESTGNRNGIAIVLDFIRMSDDFKLSIMLLMKDTCITIDEIFESKWFEDTVCVIDDLAEMMSQQTHEHMRCLTIKEHRTDNPDGFTGKFIGAQKKEYLFKPGDYCLYRNGDRMEIGRVVRRNNDDTGYFVCYHGGETAANTPDETLSVIANGYVIEQTTLGGERFEEGRAEK